MADPDPRTAFALENLKGVFAFAHAAVWHLLFANGGALVAVLGFYGNVFGDGAGAGAVDLASAAIWFVVGVALALIASTLAYVGQFCFFQDALSPAPAKAWGIAANACQLAGVGAVIAGVVVFVIGAVTAVATLGA